MKEKDFENLIESIIETGKVMRGEIPPSREYIREVKTPNLPPKTMLAVYVSDEDDALITGKQYEIQILGNNAALTDEEGKKLLCPKEWFIPVSISDNQTAG